MRRHSVSKNLFFDTLGGCLKTAGARKPPPSAYMYTLGRQEDDIGFLQMTPTAKAGVSQKRSSDSLNPLLTLFRRNTLLRPADFFDSLSLRISRCEGFFSCFYQPLEHLAAFLEVFEDAVAGGGG